MKVEKPINLKYLDLSLTTNITLEGNSTFGFILHSVTLQEIETTLIEFTKDSLNDEPRFFLMVKIFDPNNLKDLVIKKKAEIPIPESVL
jgi:hypothetical protein